MLQTSLILLIIAIIAALLGFSKVAQTSATAARILLAAAIALAIAAGITYWWQI